MISQNVFAARRSIAGALVLALSALSACSHDSPDPTYPTEPPPSPTSSAVDITYCRGAEPVWVAFQDGDGAWTRARPVANGAYTTFHGDFTANRGAVAHPRRAGPAPPRGRIARGRHTRDQGQVVQIRQQVGDVRDQLETEGGDDPPQPRR